MKLFFDTSAFVNYLVAEQGSERVCALIDDPANELYALRYMRVETLSAVCRRARAGELSHELVAEFRSILDAMMPYWHIVPMSDDVVGEAEALIG
ncbi:MAG TPA: type II toxin-antitoxin system VapC family toxin [Spirochaetota bacterium]|nr:type II toxin-antitoxin system VapC family toxin [Spirochaetota bacterium]HNT10939.1 type II toxin-antitoxin system VapC family toxin [Spirochaetota bacterium]